MMSAGWRSKISTSLNLIWAQFGPNILLTFLPLFVYVFGHDVPKYFPPWLVVQCTLVDDGNGLCVLGLKSFPLNCEESILSSHYI